MLSPQQLPDMSADSKGLYREEVFSDLKIATIRRSTPVDANGDVDTSRTVIYSGQTQLMTPGGALPLAFEIEASSLADAVAKFGDSAKKALEHTMAEIQEMRRQQASSIVIPGQEQGSFGSKFRMP